MKLVKAARRGLIAAACLLGSLVTNLPQEASAQSTIIVRNDRGGLIQKAANRVSQIRSTGQRVEIRGTCLSSCTMYLGAGNVCVSPSAKLGFHGPSSYGKRLVPQDFERWSRVMASHYKPQLQAWFMNEGRHRIDGYHRISGRQLIQMGYRSC